MEESLDKLKMPITDGAVQYEGCRVLEALSERRSVLVAWNYRVAESVQYFCDQGAIPILIKAMRARGRDPRFQASACAVVRNIGGGGTGAGERSLMT